MGAIVGAVPFNAPPLLAGKIVGRYLVDAVMLGSLIGSFEGGAVLVFLVFSPKSASFESLTVGLKCAWSNLGRIGVDDLNGEAVVSSSLSSVAPRKHKQLWHQELDVTGLKTVLNDLLWIRGKQLS